MVHRTAGRLEKQLRLEPRGKPRPNHRNGQLALPLPDSLLAWQRWDAYCPLLTPTLSSRAWVTWPSRLPWWVEGGDV